jgi:hypothetical protein
MSIDNQDPANTPPSDRDITLKPKAKTTPTGEREMNQPEQEPSTSPPPEEAAGAAPEAHHISQSGNWTTEEARPAMLRILQSALAEVTLWHDDPGFYACYGRGEDDDKVPGLLVRLIADITALFEPHTVSTTDAATKRVLQGWHITQDTDGNLDYDDEIMWSPRARFVLPGPHIEEAYFRGEDPQQYTLSLTRYVESGVVTDTKILLQTANRETVKTYDQLTRTMKAMKDQNV